MHRVVIKRIDHYGTRIVELGPWHVLQADAENWAEILRDCGYHAVVETQQGGVAAVAGRGLGDVSQMV